MDNLWIMEMDGAQDAVSDMSSRTRLSVMRDALVHAVFHSPSPLSSFLSPDVMRLVRSAIETSQTRPVSAERIETLFNETGALISELPSIDSIICSAARDLVFSLVDGPRISDVIDVLSGCYDATMRGQGFGRAVALEDQAGNEACWSVIRYQKSLLDIGS